MLLMMMLLMMMSKCYLLNFINKTNRLYGLIVEKCINENGTYLLTHKSNLQERIKPR